MSPHAASSLAAGTTGPTSAAPLTLRGELWLDATGGTLGGAARIALLAAIGETGSITRAAKAVGVSYKGAWDAVDTMNNLAGEALVARATGGKGGGGTTLTPRGVALIAAFRAIEPVHRRFVAAASAAVAGFDVDWALIGRIGMHTSARNHWLGTVASLTPGAVNDEVVLRLPGGQSLVAVVTRESVAALSLAPGVAVSALVNAASIVLVAEPDGDAAPPRLSARNQLRGEVERLVRGAVSSEVRIALDGGGTLVAVITDDSAAALALVAPVRVLAAFKASSVTLAVGA